MRGSAPELGDEGYKIRFRDQGRQFWLILCPDLIQQTDVSDVQSVLEAEDWIELLRNKGAISVCIQDRSRGRPILNAISTLEVNPRAA
jgi:hypothetical protein